MTPRADPGRDRARFAALGGPLVLVALLLFCWPFVRVPRLSLAEAWTHLLGAWALVIAALVLLSRAFGDGSPRRDPARKHSGA